MFYEDPRYSKIFLPVSSFMTCYLQFIMHLLVILFFSVLYISLHRYDNGWFFPAGEDGDFFMAGEGKGLGYNVNIPWNSVCIHYSGQKETLFSTHNYFLLCLKGI